MEVRADHPLEITRALLTRNWTFNLLGQALPAILALPAIPFIVRRLGAERFGILSIAWVLLGYFGLFDLGLGRATTKFVAECLGRGEFDRLPGLAWTSLVSQLFFGVVGALIAAAATPVAVHRLLKISPMFIHDTQTTFFILAASLPVVLVSNSLRGILEAAQRFDLVNYVRVPVNVSIFLLPVVVLPFGANVSEIVLLLVLARIAAGVAYLVICLNMFPTLRQSFSTDPKMFKALLVFGGWVTVSNIVSPLLSYLDRFVIGSMISMTAVGYYTAPADAIARVSILPGSLATTIFPAFSSLHATGSKNRLEELSAKSLKSLLLVLGPGLLLIITFARELLTAWLGADFAAKGTLVLQVLAVGTLFNSLAFVPFGLLQGLGRPDLTAKIHLLELPIYGILLWLLLKHMGIAGAAVAWTIRVTIDAGLLFGAANFFNCVSLAGQIGNGLWKTAGMVILFGVLLGLPLLTGQSLWARSLYSALLSSSFGYAAWSYLLDSGERNALLAAFGQFRGSLARAK